MRMVVWRAVLGVCVLAVAAIAVVTRDRGAIVLTAGWAVFGFAAWALRPLVPGMWVGRAARARPDRN